jgi:hypothetical protein
MNLIDSIRDGLLDFLAGIDEATITFPTTLCVSLLGGFLVLTECF